MVVEGEGHFLSEFRYIARNLVRAGVCSHPEHWPWGSYRATLGLQAPLQLLTSERTLLLFSNSRNEARRQLRRFVDDSAADAERAA